MDKFLKINQGKEDEMYAKLEAKYGLVIPKPPASPKKRRRATPMMGRCRPVAGAPLGARGGGLATGTGLTLRATNRPRFEHTLVAHTLAHTPTAVFAVLERLASRASFWAAATLSSSPRRA